MKERCDLVGVVLALPRDALVSFGRNLRSLLSDGERRGHAGSPCLVG